MVVIKLFLSSKHLSLNIHSQTFIGINYKLAFGLKGRRISKRLLRCSNAAAGRHPTMPTRECIEH